MTDHTIRITSVPTNHPRSRVWRGTDGLWHVVLWGEFGTHAAFGAWDRAVAYATTGRYSA